MTDDELRILYPKISAYDMLHKRWINIKDGYIYNALDGIWYHITENSKSLLNFHTELIIARHTGLVDKNKKNIIEGDVYTEIIEGNEGDKYFHTVCTWISEYASFCMLSTDEYNTYRETGIQNFDEVMRYSYMMHDYDFTKRVYRGNIIDNIELLNLNKNGNFRTNGFKNLH